MLRHSFTFLLDVERVPPMTKITLLLGISPLTSASAFSIALYLMHWNSPRSISASEADLGLTSIIVWEVNI